MDGAVTIAPVPCLRDNYAYLICDDAGGAWVVDPSDAAPVEAAAARLGVAIAGVLLTHHHADHTAGVPALAARRPGMVVAAHASDAGRIPGLTRPVPAVAGAYGPTGLCVAPGLELHARHIPGHTAGAIAWLIPPGPGRPDGDAFTGDTLFGAGCGRLFEGTPAQMAASLSALTHDLPDGARLWFGHEYTAANLRFAAVVEPGNAAVRRRQADLAAVTTPTTVAVEKATNPFVRAGSVAELARRRAAKDVFA